MEPKPSAPKNNTVPRNNAVKSSDSIPRNPLDPIPSASWYNSSFLVPSASSLRNSVCSHSRSVPRINKENTNGNKMSASATCSSLPPKKRRSRKGRIERRVRERENRNSSFIHDAHWANQRAAVSDIPAVPERVTQPLPETTDPTSAMRTALYPLSRIVDDSPTNENSPFQIGPESSRFPGLYKPAVPDQQQDTWTNNHRARSSGTGPRAGIIYPLQPRGRRPDVCITVEAALLRPDLPIPESPAQPQEASANPKQASRRPCRKRRRNRSTAVFRPAKYSPPRRHWCD